MDTITIKKSYLRWSIISIICVLIIFCVSVIFLLKSRIQKSDVNNEPYFIETKGGIFVGRQSHFEQELNVSISNVKAKVRGYFIKAQDFFSQNAYSQAANDYEKSVELVPTMTAYLNWGGSLFHDSQFISALEVWQKGLEITNKSKTENKERFRSAFHRNIAKYYEIQGNAPEALKHLRLSVAAMQNSKSKNPKELHGMSDIEYVQSIHRMIENVMALYLDTSEPDLTEKFRQAIEKLGHGIEPFNNGGGIAPHRWGTLWVQDLKSESEKFWYIAVLNKYTGQIVVLEGEIRNFWLSNNGYELGPPIYGMQSLRGPYLYGDQFPSLSKTNSITVWIFGNLEGNKRTLVRNDMNGVIDVAPVGAIELDGETGDIWYVRTYKINEQQYHDKPIAMIDAEKSIWGWVQANQLLTLIRKKPDGTISTLISKSVREGDYDLTIIKSEISRSDKPLTKK